MSKVDTHEDYRGSTSAMVTIPTKMGNMYDSRSSTLPEDIFTYTDHVKVDFDEVFGDPKEYSQSNVGMAMSPVIKNIFGRVYDATQAGFYYVLTIIFGIFFAIIWGLLMGLNNFIIVWILHPMIKFMLSYLRIGYLLIRAVVRTVLDPLFESFAVIFGSIRGNFKLDVRGVPDLKKATITYP